MIFAHILHDEINKIVPIDGVSIGLEDDRSTWTCHFKAEPTQEQLDKVASIIDNIKFISNEEHLENINSRMKLTEGDWKVLRKLESALFESTDAESFYKAFRSDDSFMGLLAARQIERDLVKKDYELKVID